MGKKGDEERKEGGQSMAETEGPREISENPLARQCGAAPRLRGDGLIFSLLPRFCRKLPSSVHSSTYVFSYVGSTKMSGRTEHTR